MTYFIALLCVFGITAGQVLFKISAKSLSASGSLFSFEPLVALAAAIFLYGLTSLSWVWVLQHVELGRIYPLMALAFVLVPIASYFLFGERFNIQYGLGVTLIVIGILIATKA